MALDWTIVHRADELAHLLEGFDVGSDDALGAGVEDHSGPVSGGVGDADHGGDAVGGVELAHHGDFRAVDGHVFGADEGEIDFEFGGHLGGDGVAKADDVCAVDAAAIVETGSYFVSVHGWMCLGGDQD